MSQQAATFVLSFYKHHFKQSSPEPMDLGAAGGFSGSRFWKINGNASSMALRRWPVEFRDPRRIAWIHQTVRQAAATCPFLAATLETDAGKTFVNHAGAYWQLETWMPGVANYWAEPSDEKLMNAVVAVAQFHRSAAPATPTRCASSSIQRRLELLEAWWPHDRPGRQLIQIRDSIDGGHGAEGQRLASAVCDRFCAAASQVGRELRECAEIKCDVQPILGDVWHDHVLFVGSRVSGIVDYGAMRVDSPAADVARLLGSLIGDDRAKWNFGIEQYRRVGRLTDHGERLVRIFDRSATLFSGMNWLRWIYLEKRDFGDLGPVFCRIEKIAERMNSLVN